MVTRLTDPVHGLAFDFLSNVPGGPHVMTGHEQGVITLNAEEAEDAVRERIRAEMREPYRTLVGHFRHEIGHYYWDLLVLPTPWLDGFRELFGDERADYAAALRNHYDNGPPPDWANRFVTSYASSHPVGGLGRDLGPLPAHGRHGRHGDELRRRRAERRTHERPVRARAICGSPSIPGRRKFLDFLNGWVRLTNVLNELSRSMGQPDYYPFVLPRVAVGKLQFIHEVIAEQRSAARQPRAAGAIRRTAVAGAGAGAAQAQQQSQRSSSAARADAGQAARLRPGRARAGAGLKSACMHQQGGWGRPVCAFDFHRAAVGLAAQRAARGVDRPRASPFTWRSRTPAASSRPRGSAASRRPAARRGRPGSPRPGSAAAGSARHLSVMP